LGRRSRMPPPQGGNDGRPAAGRDRPGIISAHTVRVLDGDGSVVCRRKAVATVASLTEVAQAALAGAAPGTRLEVVLEPTGPSSGCRSRCSSPAAGTPSTGRARPRRMTCAGCCPGRPRQAASTPTPWRGCHWSTRRGCARCSCPALSGPRWTARVRACDRLTQQGACHKRRLKDLVRQLPPTSPLVGELGMADLAVLERTGGDPHALLRAGPARLARLIGKASGGHHGAERATSGLPPPASPSNCTPTTPQWPSPIWPPRSKPSSACSGPPRPSWPATPSSGSTATAGSTHWGWPAHCPAWPRSAARPGRHHGRGPPVRHRQQIPIVHRPGPTRVRDRQHRPQGPAHLQGRQPAAAHHPGPRRRQRPPPGPATGTPVLRADGPARQRPPRRGLRGRRHLAERAWTVMDRGMPYVVCDIDGTPVTPEQAKQLIAEHWTVPEEVRRRRRSSKTRGKAPHQVLEGHVSGAQGATRRPSPPASLGRQPAHVKLTKPRA
jgi:hypothetical protein